MMTPDPGEQALSLGNRYTYTIFIDIDTIYSYHDECIKSEMFSRSMGGGGGGTAQNN